MKKLLALILATAMLFTLTACGSGADNNTAEHDKNTLTVKIGPISDYDPFNAYGSDQYDFMNAVYATLIRISYNSENEPECVGDLADSYTEENDGKTLVFHLKENATFSNGEPITVEDVKFSLETAAASPYQATYCSMIESVEVRDEHTVAVNITARDDTLPWAWSHVYIVNQAAYEADPSAYSASPVASGAYTLESLDAATGNMVLKAREDYWGDAPAIQTVNLRVINDDQTALISLESGQVDILTTYGMNATQLFKNDKIVLEEMPNNSMGGVYLNCQVEPWNNVKLRQAFAYAVDYAAMRNLLYDGHVGSTSTIPYNSTVDPLPEGIAEYEMNKEKAKQLVAESGVATPIDGGAIIGGGSGVAELLQQYLKEIGIVTTVSELDGGDFVTALVSGNFQIAMIPGAASAISGGQVLRNSFATGASSNYGLYSNARVDEIAGEISSVTDKDRYDELLKEAMTIVADEVPVISFGLMSYYAAHQQGLHVPTSQNGELYIPSIYWE